MNEKRNKKLRVRYRLSIVFFVGVAIFAFMFYRYMHTVTLEQVLSENRTITVFSNKHKEADIESDGGAAEDDAVEASADGVPKEVVNPVPECEQLDEDYLDNCVFIGDSITYGLSSYGVLPSSNVLSSVALSLSKAETEQIETSLGSMTVLDALDEIKPKNIYIMLGSNGAAYMTVADMYQAYTTFMNKVILTCPDSEIYIISVPPVSIDKENSLESPIQNSAIDEFNEKLLEYADQMGIHYLDLNSYLKDDTGYLPAESADNDGMHFKYSTYSTFISYILSHVAQ